MHVSAGHQGSEPVVNQEESNGNLLVCTARKATMVHCRPRPDGTFFPLNVLYDTFDHILFQATYSCTCSAQFRLIVFRLINLQMTTLQCYIATDL